MKDVVDTVDVTGHDQDMLKALLALDGRLRKARGTLASSSAAAESSIASSRELLDSLGYDASGLDRRPPASVAGVARTARLRTWDEIVAEAREEIPGEVSVCDVLDEDGRAASSAFVRRLRDQYDLAHRLDALDWGIAGIAGAVGALVDILLVKVPHTPGRLGGKAVEGGWLSNAVRDKLKNIYPPEKIKELEKAFWVPYDASTSRNLAKQVAGLGPTVHRFHSLGHDPVLGFIFGVRDIMTGQFTAIDRFGKVVRQGVPGAETGVSLFEAIARQLGHLKSDIGTPAGLPAPFMPLFQLLQVGDIDGRTIGQLSRTMYANGYDFGHFLAMSVPVMVIEVLVRLLYFAKRLHEGHSFMDSIPFDLPARRRMPKLQTMLFTAHTVATAVNAGKVYLMHNPMAVNLPQWQWYAKVSFEQLRWVLFTKEGERLELVQKELDRGWQHVNDELLRGWTLLRPLERANVGLEG